MNAKRPGYLDGVYDADAVKPKQVQNAGPTGDDDEDLGYCASRPVAKLYHALGVKRNGKRDECFEYSHLSTRYTGDNEQLDLVFAGQEKWLVIVKGRGLLKLLYFIKERRIDWVREATGNAGKFDPPDDGKPFISKIDIAKVEEDEE